MCLLTSNTKYSEAPKRNALICLDMQIDFKAVVAPIKETSSKMAITFTLKLRMIDSKSYKRNGKELADGP